MEILRQHQGPIDAIFVAVGGGGLISGIAAYVKAVRPEIRIDRRADERLRRDDPLDRSRRARRARPTWDSSPTAPRSSRSARRPSASRASSSTNGCVVDTDAACAAIKDVFEDTRSDPRAGRRARRSPRSSSTSHRHGTKGETLRRDHLRREHELRSAALRRRAGRVRRGARGAVRGDDPRGARQLPALLRTDRPAHRDRVQLPHLGCAGRARLRRHRDRRPRRIGAHRARVRAARLRRRST